MGRTLQHLKQTTGWPTAPPEVPHELFVSNSLFHEQDMKGVDTFVPGCLGTLPGVILGSWEDPRTGPGYAWQGCNGLAPVCV